MAASAASSALLFTEPLLLIGAAVAAVPIAIRLGLGSVLGYLAAGVLVGPVARLITDPGEIMHVAELGVVFFLFIIGLELKPARLWAMRADIFGLGLAQVLVTGFLLTALFSAAGWRLEPATIIGFGLAMSSTAIAMQILAERNALNQEYGRKAFVILLFQDLAIVPLLALVPLLAPGTREGFASSGFSEFVKVVLAVAALAVAGRYLINPFFRLLARTKAREIMTAAALLVVLGAASLTGMAGLSMALGAFLAGVLLAESSYRHELEANIEPFRGLLLGLFFMTVGMSINLDNVLYSWARIALAVPVVMLVKAGVLYALARLFGASHNDAVRTAVLLPQAGEFAFVLFASAAEVRALWPSETSLIAAIVTFSMALTPLSVRLGRHLLRPEPDDTIEEDFEGAGGQVLVIGFGRFGQIVAQVLLARGVDVTIIDAGAERIRQAARFGFRIYFGDGTRRDVLRAAGAEQASIVCVCVEDQEVIDHVVRLVRSDFPEARIYVRSRDRAHSLELRAKGVDFEIRETYESALAFGAEALRGLGVAPEEADATLLDIRRRDAERLALEQPGVAGDDLSHLRPTQPEPLIEPARPERKAAGPQRGARRTEPAA